jgi:hypothetical protein
MAARVDPMMARARRGEYQQGAAAAVGMITLDVNAALTSGLAVATRATSKQLIELAQAVQKGAVNNDKTAAINRRIVKKAQTATVNSYAAYRRSGGPSGYRRGEGRHPRFSGGVLRDALRSEKMIHSDSRTISFINQEHLDSEAKQWARLNFGAGPRGAGSPKSRPFPLRISNVVVADIGLDGKPSKPFSIPRGYFTNTIGDELNGAFFLSGEGPTPQRLTIIKKMPTAGIRAEHFLDNGLAVIAREFWPAYQRHLKHLTAIGVTKVRAVNTVTTNKVKAKRPRPSRVKADANYARQVAANAPVDYY